MPNLIQIAKAALANHLKSLEPEQQDPFNVIEQSVELVINEPQIRTLPEAIRAFRVIILKLNEEYPDGDFDFWQPGPDEYRSGERAGCEWQRIYPRFARHYRN